MKPRSATKRSPGLSCMDKMATNFASGTHTWDVMYMSGWVPEFAKFVTPFASNLPADLVADLPPSSFSTVTWDGKKYGAVFTLSLLTLFYNKEHLDQAGFKEPPKTWDDLKAYAKELTRDGRHGWVLNYGAPEGIGGVASYWMCFLQQAGGKLYGEDGLPAFNSEEGIAGLQVMVDLMPHTDPGSISYVGINDATNVMTGRQCLDDDELALHVEAGAGSRQFQDRRQAGRRAAAGGSCGHRVDRRHRCLDHRRPPAPTRRKRRS